MKSSQKLKYPYLGGTAQKVVQPTMGSCSISNNNFHLSPPPYLQTHSGEISMGAASGNRAGKLPETTLSVTEKRVISFF